MAKYANVSHNDAREMEIRSFDREEDGEDKHVRLQRSTTHLTCDDEFFALDEKVTTRQSIWNCSVFNQHLGAMALSQGHLFLSPVPCQGAIDGIVATGDEWSTNVEGVGAWIHFEFDAVYILNYARLMNRARVGQAFKDVKLIFDDASYVQVIRI